MDLPENFGVGLLPPPPGMFEALPPPPGMFDSAEASSIMPPPPGMFDESPPKKKEEVKIELQEDGLPKLLVDTVDLDQAKANTGIFGKFSAMPTKEATEEGTKPAEVKPSGPSEYESEEDSSKYSDSD